MGAERTLDPIRIGLKCEAVQPIVRFNAGDLPSDGRHQRFPRHRAPHHGLGQRLPRQSGRVRLPFEVLPKAADVLPQIAQYQEGAVVPEVASPWIVGCARQQVLGIASRVEQRPVGVNPIFVRIAEQELTQGGPIAVFRRKRRGRVFLLPVEVGLADAVDKAERLSADAGSIPQHPSRQHFNNREGRCPMHPLRCLRPCREASGAGVEHDHQMRLAPRAPPAPKRWAVGADVAQPARPIVLPGYARDKFGGKAGDCIFGKAKASQALAGEGDLQRCLRQRTGGFSAGDRRRREPGACRRRIGNPQQRKGRVGQMRVPEADDPLDIVEGDAGG